MRALPAALLLSLLAACASSGRGVPLAVEPARRPLPADLVAADVGRLLSPDAEASSAALARLTTLDEAGREALQAYARTIPDERDPRWLLVLDENHQLPALDPDTEVRYLAWKSSLPDRVFAWKGEGRLLELARTHSDALLRRLEAGGEGAAAVAVALALSGDRRAVPALLARYRAARTPAERREAAEALTAVAGEGRRPREDGTPAEIAQDADAIERWWRAEERAAGGDTTAPGGGSGTPSGPPGGQRDG